MSDFVPAYTCLPPGDVTSKPRTALVLHGILGSRRNWQSYIRRLLDRHPDWGFVLADLRNHGDSTGAPAPHTLDACAADLHRLMAQLDLEPDVVMGHSFGGKVALAYGQRHPEGLSAVWVLDATPDAQPHTDNEPVEARGEVQRVIAHLRAIPMPVPSREALIEAIRAAGFSQMLAGWMTTNLTRGADGFVWRFDLDGVEAMLRDYFVTDFWPLLEARAAGFPGPQIKVVRAALSDRWTPEILSRFESLGEGHDSPDGLHGPVSLHTLEEAGHWVHVDNPDGLAALISPWLDALT